MDELAGRYLTLCLRLSRLVPGLVDWYTGPDRLLAAVHSEPRRLPERLAAEADRLAADVAAEATLPTDRADWLTAQLVAVGALGRSRVGDVLRFPEHVRHVLGIDPDTFDEERAEAALFSLDQHLPGPGSIASRVAAHRRRASAPGDRTVDLYAQAVELLRPVAQQAFRLPDDEYVSLRAAGADDPLSDPRPDGRSATKVAIGSRPATLAEIVHAAARATYPGTHMLRVLRTGLLVEQFGRGECTLELRTSPGRVAAVGATAVGLDALLPPHELELLLDRLADTAGAPLDARAALAIHDALLDLDDVVPAAGRDLHARNGARARSLLERYHVRPGPDAAAILDGLTDRDRATAAYTVPSGRRLALGFLAKQDDPVAGFRRLVTEQLTPAALAAGR
ncbi:MAG TPA: hypothetical protein VGA69_10625 [Nitriliruptorales bacterium]